ncbi:uncharacterized protein LOC143047568 isoform X2 [Mytilus galloprovincialis]|uniref:uncharacterized protein LOC143047568 isoform X2 n=1 Tax=Mytilus galloprovincialis TaxID=29158 RepID=UPI003F7BCD8F
MICQFLVLATTTMSNIFPACRYSNSPNHVTANDQIISKESLFKVTCNTTGFTSAVNYDLFRISNRTAFNVTSKRSEHSLSAEVTSLVDKNTIEWYCCCPGNCADLNKNLGSIPVIVGEKPQDMITVECILKSDSTLHCNWSSDDDCIQWSVKYSSISAHGSCVSDSDTCKQQECRSSLCYLRYDNKNISLCRRCVIQLTEITPNEKLVLSFHAQNLWGEIKFNRSIYIQKNITCLDPVKQLSVTTTVDTLKASWTMPILPKPFNLSTNVTCLVETFSNTSREKKSVMFNIRQKNMIVNISSMMPATQYIVQVQCKLSKSAYWSPGARSAIFSTKSDRPLVGPELETNSFICINNSILLYFKKMDLQMSRGLVIGYQVVYPNNVTVNYTSDYLTLEIEYKNMMNDHTVYIFARNINGTSLEPTSLQVNTTNKKIENDRVTVIVEKEKNSSYVWLSVYTDPVSSNNVTTLYWCRGIVSMSGNVMCQSSFNYTKPDPNVRLELYNASDNHWQFGVALKDRPGMVWARQSCIFNCRLCGPSIPIAHRDKKIRNTLNLFLTEDFCSQNQWLPVSYCITYYPHDDVSLVKNITVAASPYLRNIVLNDVEDNTMYTISWRIRSRSFKYGSATNFTVYSGPSEIKVFHQKHVFPEKTPVIAAVSVVLLMILITIAWCLRTRYMEYNPDIDLPSIQREH